VAWGQWGGGKRRQGFYLRVKGGRRRAQEQIIRSAASRFPGKNYEEPAVQQTGKGAGESLKKKTWAYGRPRRRVFEEKVGGYDLLAYKGTWLGPTNGRHLGSWVNIIEEGGAIWDLGSGKKKRSSRSP